MILTRNLEWSTNSETNPLIQDNRAGSSSS